MVTKPGRTSKKLTSAKQPRAAAGQLSEVADKTPKKPARPPQKKQADPAPKPKLKFPPFRPFPIGERVKGLREAGEGRPGARAKPKK